MRRSTIAKQTIVTLPIHATLGQVFTVTNTTNGVITVRPPSSEHIYELRHKVSMTPEIERIIQDAGLRLEDATPRIAQLAEECLRRCTVARFAGAELRREIEGFYDAP